MIRGPPRRSRGQKGVPIVFIVEWNDHEGNQQRQPVKTLEDAKLEAASLEEKYGYVVINTEGGLNLKEHLMALISSHNAVVKALKDSDLPVPEGKMFSAMTIWHKLACEGQDITILAREIGIDAKCDMQAGRIIVYGDLDTAKGEEVEA